MAPYRERAARHPGGLVDLSIGTPVDPVPEAVRRALCAAADAPGYPQTHGTARLRTAATGWLARRHEVTVDPADVLPVIGTKELVAWLPTLLGIGPGDTVGFPLLAYPTYEIGARLARARAWPVDPLSLARGGGPAGDSGGPGPPRLLWINYPANPTGQVAGVEELRALVRWARERGVFVASDECYLELGWDASPVSVLHPRVCEGSARGLLAVHSLSKRSNLAGYRAGFVTGDPAVVRSLLEVRRHAGMMVPAPVQAAMAAALDDDAHADEQRGRYAVRRRLLHTALEKAGWRIDHSVAGLYLWASWPDEGCWRSLDRLADLGILAGPGEFYGRAGSGHVRVALTATDERVAAAAARLTT